MTIALISAVIGGLRRTWWALAVVLIFWASAAKGFNAYILYPWLDIPTHFAGGMAISLFFSATIEESRQSLGVTPLPVKLAACVGLTALAAVVWEFLEFVSDQVLHSHLNLGVTDTLSDLFFGVMGGLKRPAFSQSPSGVEMVPNYAFERAVTWPRNCRRNRAAAQLGR